MRLPVWTMTVTMPTFSPQAWAVVPSRMRSTRWISTKWLPPPMLPICESRLSRSSGPMKSLRPKTRFAGRLPHCSTRVSSRSRSASWNSGHSPSVWSVGTASSRPIRPLRSIASRWLRVMGMLRPASKYMRRAVVSSSSSFADTRSADRSVTCRRIPQLMSLPMACGTTKPRVARTVPTGMPAALWKSGVTATRSMAGSASKLSGAVSAMRSTVSRSWSMVSSSATAAFSTGTSRVGEEGRLDAAAR